jgi:citrate lyase subunit beta / citryl-CoA lyase
MNRSFLMVAGDKEKHLKKIVDLKCDVAMVNLEDGVFDKKAALKLIENCYPDGLRVNNKKIVVRVNPLDESGLEEIKVLNKLKPDGIRVAKIRNISDIQIALENIDKAIEVHLSIETKEAFQCLDKLKVDDRVTTVYLGILDLLESLGLPQSLLELNNPTIDYILSDFLVKSKIAGFHPVSFTFQEYKNTEMFTNWCKKVKQIGYTSKSAISPTQVDIINEIFQVDKQQLEKAKYIVERFEKEKLNGCTGFTDDKYGFIDEPIYKDAKLVLNKLKKVK